MEWVFSAYSHPGKVRKSNEDYFYIPTGQTAVKNLIMVADGMGTQCRRYSKPHGG